jgi:hypothetical protein
METATAQLDVRRTEEVLSRSSRLLRILAVTSLIAVLGGIAGALLGAVLLAAIVSITQGTASLGDDNLIAYFTASAIGFANGVVVGPVLAWLFLRHVPLWRAVGEAAVGAAVGASLAIAAASAGAVSGTALFGLPLLFALGAALRLRISHRGQRVLRSSEPAV